MTARKERPKERPPAIARTEEQKRQARESAWRSGNFIGLLDEVVKAFADDRPLPHWAKDALLEILLREYQAPPGKDGRHSPQAEEREKMKHFWRWQYAKALRNGTGHISRTCGKVKRVDVWALVADYLSEHSDDEVGADMVRTSYYLVEATIKDGTFHDKFFPSRTIFSSLILPELSKEPR